MHDLSGIYTNRYPAFQEKRKLRQVIVKGGSWLCLILTPWMMMALVANMIGFLELTLAAQILTTVIIACAIPQFYIDGNSQHKSAE